MCWINAYFSNYTSKNLFRRLQKYLEYIRGLYIGKLFCPIGLQDLQGTTLSLILSTSEDNTFLSQLLCSAKQLGLNVFTASNVFTLTSSAGYLQPTQFYSTYAVQLAYDLTLQCLFYFDLLLTTFLFVHISSFLLFYPVSCVCQVSLPIKFYRSTYKEVILWFTWGDNVGFVL